MLYNDYYLRNTPLILNHLPTAGVAVLLFLIVGYNVVMRKWYGRPGLSQGELLLIWGMIGIAGGIGSTGFGRAVPGWAAAPAYHTTATNEYATYLLDNIPDWMVVSKDVNSQAVKWFFEGLPSGEQIPWGEWVVPMAAWWAFVLSLYALMFAFTSVFFQRWTDRERLTYPIVYLPLEMTREPPAGRLVNDFFRNRVVWFGAALPIVVYAINGLQTYFPAIPEIPLQFGTWGLFSELPWSKFNLGSAHVYFSIIGLTFLLTMEASFSLWFFFVLYKLSFVYVAWMGAAGTGFWGNWSENVIVFEAAGAVFAVAFFLFWSARRPLLAWLRRVVTPAPRGGGIKAAEDVGTDLLPARLTFVLMVGGFTGMMAWLILAGVSWWAALLGIGLFSCVVLVLTRIVVEAGLLLVGTESIAYDFVTGLVPSSWVSGPTATNFMMLRGALMNDLREILMPYLMNGLRACTLARLHARKILAVFALTVIVALCSATYGRIATCYKYGAVQGDVWYNLMSQFYFYSRLVNYQKNPPKYEFVQVGDTRVVPVSVAHVLTGAGITVGILFLRARFLWWPLNPYGLIVCGSWAISMIWFSLLLGWMLKSSIMNFGGATAYRRALPFFLGLVLGEAIIATVWIGVSFITGSPGIYMLPD